MIILFLCFCYNDFFELADPILHPKRTRIQIPGCKRKIPLEFDLLSVFEILSQFTNGLFFRFSRRNWTAPHLIIQQ